MNLRDKTNQRTGDLIAVFGRSFWPAISDVSLRLLNFAKRVKQCGPSVMILSPRWHATWPERIVVNDLPVTRLSPSPLNPLTASKYRKAIWQWLDSHGALLRGIYCDQPGADSLAVCTHPVVSSGLLPVVVRFDHCELSSSSSDRNHWQPTQAIMEACAAASKILVPYLSSQQLLLRWGIDPARIVLQTDWAVDTIDCLPAARSQARRALAAINSDLAIRTQERLLLVPGEFTQAWQLENTIEALVPLLDEFPRLRVWLHGDGPLRESLYQRLNYHGHHRNVVMPGIVTSIETLIQAADLCLLPAAGVGQSWILPSCLISGVSTLVAESPELIHMLGGCSDAISFNGRSATDLQSKVTRWLTSPNELAAASRQAGNLIRRQRADMEKLAYDQLFDRGKQHMSLVQGSITTSEGL